MSVGRELGLLATALTVSLMALASCQDTAKHAVRVRQPAATPQTAVSSIGNTSLEGLPLPSDTNELAALMPLPSAQQSAVDALIEKVEARYNAGQQAYQAGQPDVARKDFNAAVNLLMKNNLEATGDVRLQQLFNRIVDTMQSYEMEVEAKDEATAEANEAAAESADNADNGENADNAGSSDNANSSDTTDTGTSEDTATQAPQSTAPIEEVAELENLPATDPKLAALAEKELITVQHDLPLTINASVLQYLSFFASPRGREIVEMGLERAGRYRAMIESTLKKEGLPLDLIYLAQAESAFKPKALSSKGARGIWQFMPYSGEMYGLHRTYWVDERDDPVAATEAAAETLRDLYQTFGDWYLAMAAYNSGPMNVTRAVERTGYADFWTLQKMNALPAQTKNYVPIILALALVAKDPGLYGIQVAPDAPPEVETFAIEHSISLRLVSDATGASLDDLQGLNPELVRGIAPAGFTLLLPKGTAEELEAGITDIPADKLASWRLVKFAQGDTLASVARKYHVTVASLENVNMIDPHDPPDAGKMLIVPAAPPRLRLVHYRVRRGDTLSGIASRYSVSVGEIEKWNHLRSVRAPRGQLLRIYEESYPGASLAETRNAGGAHAELASGKRVIHRVISGETLWSIAREYGTTVEALKAGNPYLQTRGLQVGDRLSITPR